MNLKCNILNTDDPSKQIPDCINIINEIDKVELEEGEILDLDFSDVEWVLPCSALLLSNKIIEACRRIDIKKSLCVTTP